MKALINKATNQLEQWVESGDKYDLTKYTVVDPPPGDISMLTWNGAALVTRALRPVEVRAKALNDDARLAMLRNSTPQQIHTYVLANVTTVAQARDHIEFLMLVVAAMLDRRQL